MGEERLTSRGNGDSRTLAYMGHSIGVSERRRKSLAKATQSGNKIRKWHPGGATRFDFAQKQDMHGFGWTMWRLARRRAANGIKLPRRGVKRKERHIEPAGSDNHGGARRFHERIKRKKLVKEERNRARAK